MTKTPEELTADWKAGKLPAGWYYLNFENGEIELQNNCIGGFLMSRDNKVMQVLAPVPTYGEYKAMQEQIAEHRHYCCCAENEKLQLDKDELEEEIANLKKWEKHTWDYDLQAKRISELLADNKKMQEQVVRLNKYIEQWQKAYQDTVTENCSVKNECAGLCALLKECKANLSYKINKDKHVGFTPTAANLLTRINAAIGESED